MSRVLITGGAGFVGSNLAVMLKRDRPALTVCAFDNLRRRGSELAMARLRAADIEFIHGDVRVVDDLTDAGRFDVLLECSAEPSVHAGFTGSPTYVLQTNLVGTINCLEAARRCAAAFIFVSTSRVYPIAALRALPLMQTGKRLAIPEGRSGPGWSAAGITTEFPLAGHRSLYGASKLASELLIEEYRALYGIRTVINRCGVIAGPWQMGKVDQGFVALWAARHLFGDPVTYIGFGGEGFQVRDVLHVADLYDLIVRQLDDLARHTGATYNVGGGIERSVSLAELTVLCSERASPVPTASSPATSPADVPYYVTDNTAVSQATGWVPRRSVSDLVDDVFGWLRAHRAEVEPYFRSAVPLPS